MSANIYDRGNSQSPDHRGIDSPDRRSESPGLKRGMEDMMVEEERPGKRMMAVDASELPGAGVGRGPRWNLTSAVRLWGPRGGARS
mmetsp:Transcript_643/g.1363  ORF Transcript_643/g.1363 Transcript_643/m.1363 type:complete len:86 (-) Transcript_643:1862-2119(-)